jgi:hypothetical protein
LRNLARSIGASETSLRAKAAAGVRRSAAGMLLLFVPLQDDNCCSPASAVLSRETV